MRARDTDSGVTAPAKIAPIARTKKQLAASRSLLAKCLRLATFLMVVALAFAALGVRKAASEGKKLAMALGEELGRLSESEDLKSFTKLSINGQSVSISSATTDVELGAVLDRFQNACESHADGLSKTFANLPPAVEPNAAVVSEGFPGAGAFKLLQENTGVVVCFAQGAAPDAKALLARFGKFARSGDLGDIGGLRYVTASKTPKGKTHVVAVWTDGSFNVKKAFPNEGDAPGSDLDGALRPSDARRLLSAYAEGAPYGIREYATKRTVVETLGEFDAEMPKLGWASVHRVANEHPEVRAFSKGVQDVIVTAHCDGEQTTVSIVQMGRSNR